MAGVLVAFLLLPALCCGAPWFVSTCREPTPCRCVTDSGMLCQAGPFNSLRPSTDCAQARRSAVELNFTCVHTRSCDSIRVLELHRFFFGLRFLSLQGCQLDFAGFEVLKEDSNLNFSAQLGRQSGMGSPFALFLQTRLHLQPANTTASDPPPCRLYELSIGASGLFRFPIGYLARCRLIERLMVMDNPLVILDAIDTATIADLPRLYYLRLNNNSLIEIGNEFIDLAMETVKLFFMKDLEKWIVANLHFLNTTEVEAFNQLNRIFKSWSPMSPLIFRTLISVVESCRGLDLDFVVNQAPVEVIHLNNNHMKEVPDAFFGFNKVTEIHLKSNAVKYNFRETRGYIFYAFRKTLRDIRLEHNRIDRIGRNGFKYLRNIKSITISNNPVSSVSGLAIPPNNTIMSIYMQFNRLTVLGPEILMFWLLHLDVSYNNITYLESFLAKNIPNIKVLNLTGNPIITLSPLRLELLPMLTLLELQFTNLSHLASFTFRMPPRVSREARAVVDVRHNRVPMNCDCFSVFPGLKSERNKVVNFIYPRVLTSANQRCASQHRNDTQKLLSDMKRFDCVFIGKKCNETHCSCCHNTNRCKCRFTCPDRCVCNHHFQYKFFNIDCAHKNITFIPEVTFGVVRFYINHNCIRTIARNVFGKTLATLRSLHLCHNRIEFIDQHVFRQLRQLRYIDLSYNRIHFIDSRAFRNSIMLSLMLLTNLNLPYIDYKIFVPLVNLSYVDLRQNAMPCNCDNLPKLLNFSIRGGAGGSTFMNLPNYCVQDNRTVLLDHQTKICRKLSTLESQRQWANKWRIRVALMGGGGFLLLLSLLLLVSHHRFRLKSALDSRVRSAICRSLLSLSGYNRACRIDVAFLVHERQTDQYRDVQRHLLNSPRRALRMVRLADHMPGSLRLCGLASIAKDVAVCVVLLSVDLLEDAVSAEALRLLLVQYVECGAKAMPAMIPVLLHPTVTAHELWPPFGLLLRHWPLLCWRKPFFWERLMTALPPPPPNRKEDDDEEEAREPLLPSPQTVCLADLCIIADEAQVVGVVRRLFDRLRDVMRLCHMREDLLFALPASEAEGYGLNAALALCPQVILVVTPELLMSKWMHRRLAPALTARLETLPFRASLIWLETNAAVAHLCREERFQVYDRLRSHRMTVTLLWPGVEADWSLLVTHLLPAIDPEAAALAMDEAEFAQLLCRPATTLQDAGEETATNIFQQNLALRRTQGLAEEV